MMKAVSLFAGVGGFDLALTNNGAEVVASVEIDKHARKVLQKQFPNTTHLEDVKNVTGQQLFDLGFNADGIIVGGFPCQDLSVAGKRRGLAGERSGLFFEVVRLLDETKAKWFILENVPGLLSSNGGRDLGIVIGALAELRYGVAYRILDAQYFGVPQRRRRIFIVGCLGDDGRTPAEILAISESRARYLAKGEQKGKATANPITTGSGSDSIASCIPAKIYHKSTIVNQDVNSGHLVIGALQARDFKGVGNQYVAENKLVVQEQTSANS
jgi:DNA (cytosine-5)-methyltransferase 1